MICKECGTKNDKGSRFCGNCGHSLKKQFFFQRKLTKKEKVVSISAFVVLLFVIGISLIGNYYTSPKFIASNYFEAVAYAKGNKLYQTLGLEETSPFTSKKMVTSLLKEQQKNEDINVVNYKVTKILSLNGGLRKSVEINYVDKSNEQIKTTNITLTKNKKKKWLFFDNWTVDTNDFETIDSFTLSTIKGSKLKIENIDLTPYLNKEKSTESVDVYELPTMFQTTYKVNATLPFGFDIEDTIVVNKNRQKATITFNEESLSNEIRNNLLQISKTSLEQLYAALLEKKNFSDIKDNYQHEGSNTSNLEKNYTQLLNTLSTSGLKSITFNKIDLTNVEVTNEGYLYLGLKVNYDYLITYTTVNGEQKENSSSDYDYINLTYDYKNNEFHFVDFKNLMTYFSRYF